MKIDSQHRLTDEVKHFDSPFFNDRPDETDISLLVIHCISLPPGEFNTPAIHELFMGTMDSSSHPYYQQIKEIKVSAHVVIFRTGEIIQYIPFNKRAWHAGKSSFQDKENCNDYAIGIELEGTETTPYEPAQYESLIKVTQAIQKHYPTITQDKIVGHSDIAPTRKEDPGPTFNWSHYKKTLPL